jgi:prevent-host-death family protein
MTKIGANDVGRLLPQLLERVATGERIAITQNGREIAHLVPATAGNRETISASAAVARWRNTRIGVKLGGESIRALIEQGRR